MIALAPRSLRGEMMMGMIVVVQPAVTALALLVLRNALEQVMAAEIRPQRGCDIDLCVGQLPEQEVAEPHLPAGAHDQVRVRQVPGVEMAADCFLIYLQMLYPAIARRRLHQR